MFLIHLPFNVLNLALQELDIVQKKKKKLIEPLLKLLFYKNRKLQYTKS